MNPFKRHWQLQWEDEVIVKITYEKAIPPKGYEAREGKKKKEPEDGKGGKPCRKKK